MTRLGLNTTELNKKLTKLGVWEVEHSMPRSRSHSIKMKIQKRNLAEESARNCHKYFLTPTGAAAPAAETSANRFEMY
jgi:hypothetical protein